MFKQKLVYQYLKFEQKSDRLFIYTGWVKSNLLFYNKAYIVILVMAMNFSDRGYFFSIMKISKLDPVGIGWGAAPQK